MFRQAKAKHMGFLSSVLWKLTGDRELFTEALQNSLLEMWKHAEKLDGPKAPAYIYRIALSANSKAWRNRIGKNGEIKKELLSSEKNPSQLAIDSELAKLIRREVSQLAPQQTKAIVLRYFQQKDYKDIANNLNCTEAGARSHVSKAIAALKNRLATLA